jgi:hypothetical protein
MKHLIPLLLLLASPPAFSDPDPAQICRERYAGDCEARIACLEAALAAALGADAAEDDAGRDAADEAVTPVVSDGDREEKSSGLGAEQIRAQPRPEEAAIDTAPVRIVLSRYDAQGKGTFLMEDGQVWQETMAAPRRMRLDPDRQYDARIERGKLGGYRLYVDGIRGMLTVRRLK